jgi:hypothetical protein
MKHAEAYTRRDVNREISGSHSRRYEDDSRLRYYTMQSHISTPDISEVLIAFIIRVMVYSKRLSS